MIRIEKLEALEIIFSSPVWPKYDLLSNSGKSLYSSIMLNAKEYSLLIVQEDYVKALLLATEWTPLINEFLQETLIHDSDADKQDANLKILAVFRHYLNALSMNLQVVK